MAVAEFGILHRVSQPFFLFRDIRNNVWYHLTFVYPERLFGESGIERKERRRAKSGAEAGVPFRGCRSVGRSDPERLERNGTNGENVWGIHKTSENIITFSWYGETQKTKTYEYIGWYPNLALISSPFLTNFDAKMFQKHSKLIKNPYSTLWILQSETLKIVILEEKTLKMTFLQKSSF